MTKKELGEYVNLNEKFLTDCDRVCRILSDSKKRQGECKDISYAERFRIDDNCDDVYWEGDEYWNYGGHEEHWGNFPSDFLTMSDDELRKIVEKENEELEAAQRKKEAEKAEQEKAKRMAQYEELKREFENS